MNNYRFYKEENNWFVDLPKWEGSKESLQMVAGADSMLDLFSNDSEEVTLTISTEKFEGSEVLRMISLADDIGEGAYYNMEAYMGHELNLEMWLCGVTQWVFGYYPDVIYVSKFK